MFSSEAENVYEVFKSLHFCSGLIGLTSFSILRADGKFVQRTSLFNIFCLLFASIWNLTMTKIYLNNFDHVHEPSLAASGVYMTSLWVLITSFTAITLLVNWWSFFARKYFPDIINILSDVDDELSKVDAAVNLKKHKRMLLIFIFSTKIFLMITAICTHFDIELTSNKYMVYVLMLGVFTYMELNVFITCHFTFWMWTVMLRYQKINSFLIKSFSNPDKNIFKRSKNSLDICASLHEKLVDASEIINQCYGIPVIHVDHCAFKVE